jgi:hypothetical protein
MKRLYKNKEKLIFLGLIAIYLLWSFDNNCRPAEAGLDPSWRLGLNWANNIGAQWGKDFLFTYGPLYHFSRIAILDFYSSKAYLLIQVGINLFYSVIKAGVVFFFYLRANSSYKIRAAIVSGIIMLLCVFDYLELLAFFITLLLCDSYYELSEDSMSISRRLIMNNVLSSLLLVILQYTKFSFFNIAAVLIILLSVFYIFRRKYKIFAIFIGSYIFLSILLWIISGQSIKYLFGYFYSGFQLSSGYTSAMHIEFADFTIFNIFVFSLVTIGSFVIILIYFIIKKKYFIFSLCFLISPQIFLLFKESFVRADGHAYIFICNIPLITLYLLFVSLFFHHSQQQNRLFGINPFNCAIIIAIIVTWISISVANINFLPKNNAFQVLKDYIHYESRIKETKQQIRTQYRAFDELTEYVDNNEKIDIFPWDISLLYAYDLNWQPRPVMQSYTNYTPALDKLTARHFLTEKKPDKLIHTPMTIDGRYALFDEPETFRTVLINYSSITDNDTYLILEKRQRVNPVNMEEIHTITAKTGEIIGVPFSEDAYVFMGIDWDFNFLGKIANFLFRTTTADIEIYLMDGSKSVYRMVHKNAKNGLFVSKHVSNTQELKQVFDRDFIPDITGVRILGRSLFYKKNVKVNFYKILF